MSNAAVPCPAGDHAASAVVWVDATTPNKLLLALGVADSVLQLVQVVLVLGLVALEVVDSVAEVVAEVLEATVEVASVGDLVAVAVEAVEAVGATEAIVVALGINPTATGLQMVHLPVLVVPATLVAEATVVQAIEAEEAGMEVIAVIDATTAAGDPAERTTSPWVVETDTAIAIARVGMEAETILVQESVVMKATTKTRDNAGGTRLRLLLSALCYGLSKGYVLFRHRPLTLPLQQG